MTHEPECFYDGERDVTEWRDAEDSPCICEQLTTAYQRGRENAAQDVQGLGSLLRWISDTGWLPGRFESVDAIAAARGEWQA